MNNYLDSVKKQFAYYRRLGEKSLERTTDEGHTIMEAINRQLAHYPYHIGQMVFLAKMLSYGNWESLSIPKNSSSQYNQEKFNQDKGIRHFTDGEIKKL